MARPSERERSGEEKALLKELGERVAIRRTAFRMSQRELSVVSGVDMTSISRLEGGLVSPTLVTVIALARALQVPLDWLALGSDRMRYPEPQSAAQPLEEIEDEFRIPQTAKEWSDRLNDFRRRLEAIEKKQQS